MAVEHLDLFLKGQSSHSLDIDFIPRRCGSAPPSMEGSRTSIESIFTKRKSTLNPRFVYQNISTKLIVYSKNSLPVQEEESEEDLSSEQSLSVEKTTFDEQQEDSQKTSSLSYDPSRHKSIEKAAVSDADSHFYKKEQPVHHNKLLHQQAASHDGITPQFTRSYSQITYPGINHAYGRFNQFHYNSLSASITRVQPLVHSSGFTPPLYTAAALLNSSIPFYPNLHPAGFFPSQCGISGYTFNYPVLPIYMAENPYRAVPVVFNGNSFPTPRVSNGGRVHGQKVPLPYLPLSNEGYNNLSFGRGDVSSHYSFGNGCSPGASAASNQCCNDTNLYSLLDELKTGKGPRLELCDISGYFCEFSVDQHGSRFIQQRLETCTVEEKAYVFKEVGPHASQLMTHVFGNYVIQKLFEYGNPEQRKFLADQLKGEVVPLTLHMYGCRVIQKALEFIDLEQKARLVRELDGHVTRCVHDQNGNHVIQKCIESIPSYNIRFIISSFRGQVAALSMHPYGCRVIQRVLEHCKDELQAQFIVDEILDSVSSLAQDQYGNYVLQHVLERNKDCERKEIIEKLSKSIVQLSQNKFASNVIEKCLEYSDSFARDMLIKEITGHCDKNDNLWTMMKDQYGNYVVQKILQKCTSDQRKMLLGVIRNHLIPLKKYTHGKHIAARFEELYGEETDS